MSPHQKTAPTFANPLRRNVAIIAHVDHGKTTLVDAMLHQSGIFRANERVAERVMDNTDLERERGITILAKNTAVHYRDILINIVDTPGHADFGGEVERTLSMVDGVLLLVDASEGPLPQTRFVLRKALERRLTPIVVINKIDRPDARAAGSAQRGLRPLHRPRRHRGAARFPGPVHERASGHVEHRRRASRARTSGRSSTPSSTHVPPPRGDADAPLQMLVANLDSSDYLGRIAIGRIFNGRVKVGDPIAVCKLDGTFQRHESHQALRLRRAQARRHRRGGRRRHRLPGGHRGHHDRRDRSPTSSTASPMPPIAIDEPTVSMIFGVNTSPMAGREGQYVTSRQIKDRLDRELLGNVSIRVEPTDTPEQMKVLGRGELQLSILIEMMRREGFELQVSRPDIVTKDVDGQVVEPVEDLVIDVAGGVPGRRHRAGRRCAAAR